MLLGSSPAEFPIAHPSAPAEVHLPALPCGRSRNSSRRGVFEPTPPSRPASRATRTAHRRHKRLHRTGSLPCDPHVRRAHGHREVRSRVGDETTRSLHQDRKIRAPDPLVKALRESWQPSPRASRAVPRYQPRTIEFARRPTLRQDGSERRSRFQSACHTFGFSCARCLIWRRNVDQDFRESSSHREWTIGRRRSPRFSDAPRSPIAIAPVRRLVDQAGHPAASAP